MSWGKMSHIVTFYPLSLQRNYTVKTRGKMLRVKYRGAKRRGVKCCEKSTDNCFRIYKLYLI